MLAASSSSLLVEDFANEHSPEKDFYPSYHSTSSTTFLDDFVDREEFPPESSDEATSTSTNSQCRTTVDFDPRLGVLIESELGLNDPQTSRKNAWGNLSYAELIAKAIENSEDKRLTLSQIYSWMIQYVPYFRDKGDRKSSTGWKVSSISSSFFTSLSFGRILFDIIYLYTIGSFASRMRSRASRVGGQSIRERNKSEEEEEFNRMTIQTTANQNEEDWRKPSLKTFPIQRHHLPPSIISSLAIFLFPHHPMMS